MCTDTDALTPVGGSVSIVNVMLVCDTEFLLASLWACRMYASLSQDDRMQPVVSCIWFLLDPASIFLYAIHDLSPNQMQWLLRAGLNVISFIAKSLVPS